MSSEHPEPSGIDPDDLTVALRVLEQLPSIDETHPDSGAAGAKAQSTSALKRDHPPLKFRSGLAPDRFDA